MLIVLRRIKRFERLCKAVNIIPRIIRKLSKIKFKIKEQPAIGGPAEKEQYPRICSLSRFIGIKIGMKMFINFRCCLNV